MSKIKTEEGSENSGILKLRNAWLCNSYPLTIQYVHFCICIIQQIMYQKSFLCCKFYVIITIKNEQIPVLQSCVFLESPSLFFRQLAIWIFLWEKHFSSKITLFIRYSILKCTYHILWYTDIGTINKFKSS